MNDEVFEKNEPKETVFDYSKCLLPLLLTDNSASTACKQWHENRKGLHYSKRFASICSDFFPGCTSLSKSAPPHFLSLHLIEMNYPFSRRNKLCKIHVNLRKKSAVEEVLSSDEEKCLKSMQWIAGCEMHVRAAGSGIPSAALDGCHLLDRKHIVMKRDRRQCKQKRRQLHASQWHTKRGYV